MSTPHTSSTDYDYLFKILIIGDVNVGKTALLQRFAEKCFPTDYLATIGVDFKIRQIEVDSKRCKLQIWDTAGQERFKSLLSSYYRGAHGIIICFDLTEMLSFEHVDTWLSESKRFCVENTPVYLAGTKADLKSERVVTNEAIEAFCSKNNLPYIETSAMANENVEEGFKAFAKMLISRSDEMQIDDANRKIDSKIIDPRSNRRLVPDESGHGCNSKGKCAI